MADVGFLSTLSVSVGQTLRFSWAQAAAPASLPQQAQGVSDVIFINNLSACTFRVTLDATARSFTLPAGVPTSAIPVAWGGTNDTSCSLYVENIGTQASPNQVHFDYFPAGQPIIYVAASGAGNVGSISLTNVTTGQLEFPSPDDWKVTEDGSGNLLATDTTTGITYVLGRNGQLTLVGPVEVDNTGPAIQQQPASPTSDMGLWHVKEGTAGAVEWSVQKGHHAGGNDNIYFFDDTNNQNQFAIGPKTGAGIAVVAGQNTAGSFGVAPIVAQKFGQTVTATGLTAILTYTPPANGLYRVSCYVEFNSTVGSLLVLQATYADDLGAATKFFTYSGGGATSPLLLNGGNSFGPPISMPIMPMVFYAKTTANIVISYNDPSGVPNDAVWATIERIA